MMAFKVGDKVRMKSGTAVNEVLAVHGEAFWLLTACGPCTYLADDFVLHVDTAKDSDPATDEWLERVGLMNGKQSRGGSTKWYFCADSEGDGVYIRHGEDATWANSAMSTVGDVRQFCRLMGVELGEA